MNLASLWYLESVDLYKILCPHKVKEATHKHVIRTYVKNDYIYVAGQPSTNIYLIAEGRIEIGHTTDHEEVITSILTKGEIFGELAIAAETQRKDFARAVVQSVVCEVTIEDLKALMWENRELSFKLLKLVGLRLMKLERKLELLVFKDARTRIIEFLKDAASWKGRKVGHETVIHTHLTHKDISALTGTSRQTVTMVLNDLRDKNLITFNRRSILVRDLEKLS